MCNGCLSGAALDRYAAALVELRDRKRYRREEIARLYDVPLALLPEEETL